MCRQAHALETDQEAADGDDDGSDADSTGSWLINDEAEADIDIIGEKLVLMQPSSAMDAAEIY